MRSRKRINGRRLLGNVGLSVMFGFAAFAGGAGGLAGPMFAHASPVRYYFHGTSTDQANRTSGSPTATFDTVAPTGTTDILQTGTDPIANEAVPYNAFTIYWVSNFAGTVSGPMTFDWYWSASPADFAIVDAIDVNVYADVTPSTTSGVAPISGTSGINLPLTVGATPVLNHTTVTVNGTITSNLLIQVRQHFTNEGTTNTVHYDSVGSPSSFTVGSGTPASPSPSPTPVPSPTPSAISGNQGPQLFDNYTSPYPYPHEPPGPVCIPTQGCASLLFGEPSLGVDWVTNDTMYQGDLNTWRVHFDYTVRPPAAVWNDRSDGSTDASSLDARLITDHLGAVRGTSDRTVVDQLHGAQSVQAYSDSAGGTAAPPANSAAWVPSSGGGIPSGADHESTGSGPFHLPLPATANPAVYQHAVYYCSQNELLSPQPGPIDFCARSDDGGATYGQGIGTYTQAQCGGLHGKPRVGPDGTVYLPNKDCTAGGGTNAAKGLVVSSDNGATWTVHYILGTTTDDNQSDSDVAIGGGSGVGTVYYGYRDGDHHMKVVVSNDQGNTWSAPFDIGAAFGIQNAQFPAAIAGDQDRAAVSFIGTPAPGSDLSKDMVDPATGRAAIWHMYTSFTYDGGKTWQTVDDTPTDPVQRGGVCMQGTGCADATDRNMLDFNDSNVDRFGRVQVAYTDGCSGACETDPNAASCSVGNQNCTGRFSSVFSMVDQVCGRGLFVNGDPGFFNDPACALAPVVPEANLSAGMLGGGLIALAIGWGLVRRRRRRGDPEWLPGQLA